MDLGLTARCVLAKMFDVEERDIVFKESRSGNKVTARRFYNYYLWRHKKVKHNYMKDYIKGLHHATSIYHCRLLEKELEIYKKLRKQFITFLYYSDQNEWEKLKINKTYSMKELNDNDYKKYYIDIIN